MFKSSTLLFAYNSILSLVITLSVFSLAVTTHNIVLPIFFLPITLYFWGKIIKQLVTKNPTNDLPSLRENKNIMLFYVALFILLTSWSLGGIIFSPKLLSPLAENKVLIKNADTKELENALRPHFESQK